jgi:hypothetical protein
MIALAAVFALLVQALAPAFAVAAPGFGGGVICTSMGAQPAPDDGGGAPPADHACKHCVCPSPTNDPPRVAAMVRVAYVEAPAPFVETARGRVPQARAPPRPPGQGPPPPNA